MITREQSQKAAAGDAVAAAVLRELARLGVYDAGGLEPLHRRLLDESLRREVVEVLDRELGPLTWGEWWNADRED